MATKAAKEEEASASRDSSADDALLDGMSAAVKKLVGRGKERGYITYDEINQALPPDQTSSEQIEDVLSRLSEMGINVVESEEAEEQPSGETAETERAGNVDTDEVGRTDDPVRMYLREMGAVELLSREGEIAIAKRIEAGREKVIGAICESPLTMRAVVSWREALLEGTMLLRDIIDLEATYGGTQGASNNNAAATQGNNAAATQGNNAAATQGNGAAATQGNGAAAPGNAAEAPGNGKDEEAG